jgi:hypothetical protein
MASINLEGRWFIHYTNFPMWLKGDKLHPSLNYRWIEQKGWLVLDDQVVYTTRKGKEQTIRGISSPTSVDNKEFIWRGKGWLSWVTSRWSIVKVNQEQEWMAIAFLKTWFTPAGVEVISKQPILEEEAKEAILSFVNQLPIHPPLQLIR